MYYDFYQYFPDMSHGIFTSHREILYNLFQEREGERKRVCALRVGVAW